MILLTFDRPEIPLTFSSALLGGLLHVLQTTQRNVPLLVCCSSDVLSRVLVHDRLKSENNLLDPNFHLLKSVLAMLNERVARIHFRKVTDNRAKALRGDRPRTVEIDTEIDLMFESPGMLLSHGSQRFFTKIIRKLRPRIQRKSTFVNLDRVRCSIQEISNYTPTDQKIWRSIRSTTFQRLTREFFWKCIHNTFRVGDFWTHIDTLQVRGRCHSCDVPETLEHLALECNAPGQQLIWHLAQQLWSKKYGSWPTLSWGLILGCNLLRFKSDRGTAIPEKSRLFAILVSVSWHLIWNIRQTRVIENPDTLFSNQEIHNRWLRMVNGALQRDRILTDKIRFGSLALNKVLVLKTWSGLLMDEDSLPDDWTHEGVLVIDMG
jgi:hypothetical protein